MVRTAGVLVLVGLWAGCSTVKNTAEQALLIPSSYYQGQPAPAERTPEKPLPEVVCRPGAPCRPTLVPEKPTSPIQKQVQAPRSPGHAGEVESRLEVPLNCIDPRWWPTTHSLGGEPIRYMNPCFPTDHHLGPQRSP